MAKRIGPKMARVAWLADQPGGIKIIDAARLVGPHGSLQYGYEIVNRAISAGIVVLGTVMGRNGQMVGVVTTL
jgi:hypothetical protein